MAPALSARKSSRMDSTYVLPDLVDMAVEVTLQKTLRIRTATPSKLVKLMAAWNASRFS